MTLRRREPAEAEQLQRVDGNKVAGRCSSTVPAVLRAHVGDAKQSTNHLFVKQTSSLGHGRRRHAPQSGPVAALRAPSPVASRADRCRSWGHGLRHRGLEGPRSAGAAPEATEIAVHRYRCRACKAVMVVLPRGVARGYRYSLSAIAWALWAYEQLPAAAVRARTSTAKYVGATGATRWTSLRRWTRCAATLFGIAASARTAPVFQHGSPRLRAALCSYATVWLPWLNGKLNMALTHKELEDAHARVARAKARWKRASR